MKNVVIVGAGFVGATAYQAFSKVPGWNVMAYDAFPETCKLKQDNPDAKLVSWEETEGAGLYFICLPTPMDKETGECFTGLVESAVREIRQREGRGVSEIVIKSTVPPGTTKRLNSIDHGFNVFFNPEFLTEANAYSDFVTLPYQIVGTPQGNKPQHLVELYRDAEWAGIFREIEFIFCDSTVAEMVKLTRNCYLATRLSFFNEIKQICDKLDINYDEMRRIAGLDVRVGSHYNTIPGPDGKVGFGGSCLCKDINDLMYVAKSLKVDPKTMFGAWEKNLEIRPERDWEELKGRAVVEKTVGK